MRDDPVVVLIPAYEPTARLIAVVEGVRSALPGAAVLVVDDGSGPEYGPIFARVAQLGATVLVHPHNQGKGAALKSGLSYVLEHHPGEGVVTADSDGQHTVADIVRIARASEHDPDSLVLGCRAFGHGTPVRSRVGNSLSAALFGFVTGTRVGDTQTGLRGLPGAALADLVRVPGEHFEYEQNVLLRWCREKRPVTQIEIATIYLDRNAGSHFRPIVDSLRVIAPVAKFAASSLTGFVIDMTMLAVMMWLTGNLVVSVVTARLVSASVNFTVNRIVVFERRGPGVVRDALRYAGVAAVLLASNLVWMTALTGWGLPWLAAKVVTELVLFVTSYQAQRTVVFDVAPHDGLVRGARPAEAGAAPVAAQRARERC